MSQQYPKRRSGAPPWAVSLGLGTRWESAQRPWREKLQAWIVYVIAMTALLAAFTVAGQTSLTSGLLIQCLLIATVVVAGAVAVSALIDRRRRWERS